MATYGTALHARRLKRVAIGSQFLPLLLGAGAHGFAVVEDPVPGDTVIVGAECRGLDVVLTIWSTEFAPIPEGATPPALSPIFRRLDRVPEASEN